MPSPPPPPNADGSKPTSERDPFGSRHALANLAMMAVGLEGEPVAERDFYRVAVYGLRIVAHGMLFTGDMLGSILLEARQWRADAARRPPRAKTPT